MRISLFLTLLLLLLSKNAYAYTCTFDTNAFSLPATTIYVDSSLAAGEKIGSLITGSKTYMTCTDISDVTTQDFLVGALGVHVSGTGSSTFLIYDKHFIYKTKISGVGFAVGSSAINCNNNTTSWVNQGSGMQNASICKSYASGTKYTTFAAIPTVQLYRTYESLNSGTTNETVGYLTTTINNNTPTNAKDAVFSLNVTIRKSTCKVSTKTLNIELPPISQSAFTGYYSSAGNTAFGIDLTCGEETPVALRFDSANVSTAVLGTLKNEETGSDAASGVGIQIVQSDGETPFKIGSEVNVGNAVKGSTRFSFVARYSQLSKTSVTPGKVKSTATFTVTYK